uniref:Uncharacterized protein n=1 Tax=Oryza meridionalis TaxID=40149 RepID=A0A0E0EA47_9ORYZ
MDGDEVSLAESRLLNFGVDLLFSLGVNPSHCRRFSWGRAPVDWEHGVCCQDEPGVERLWRRGGTRARRATRCMARRKGTEHWSGFLGVRELQVRLRRRTALYVLLHGAARQPAWLGRPLGLARHFVEQVV